MHSWTISRRIVTGFAVLVALTAGLGLFALRQIGGLRKDIGEFNANTLPSVVTLGECSSLIRDNLAAALQFTMADSDTRRAELEKRILANRSEVDRLFANYDKLISDDEDRRLFEEVKRHRMDFKNGMVELSKLPPGPEQQKRSEERRVGKEC